MAMDPKEWRGVCDRLNGRGRHLLETGLWSDCEVLVGVDETRTSFRLHRTILAMASAVFAVEFFEGQEHTPLNDVDPVIFKQLLKYIYTDECRVDSVEVACSLARLAYRFMVQLPIKVCVAFLSANIRVQNVCKIMETAIFIRNTDLSDKALKIICKDTKQVLNHASFLDVEVETVSTIFKQMMLNIDSELDLVDAIVRYLEANSSCLLSDNSKSTSLSLRDAIRHIRFSNLSLQEFSKVSKKLTLLTNEESLLIFQKLASPDEDSDMPRGFTSMTIDRIKIPCHEANSSKPNPIVDFVDEVYLEKMKYKKIIDELKIELNQEKKNKLECEKTISKLETKQKVIEANIDILETDKSELKKTIAKLEAEVNTLSVKCKTNKSDIAILTKEKDEFKTKITKLHCKISNSTLLRCSRTIDCVTIVDSKANKWFYLKFNVDTAVSLFGLQLPTQVNSKEGLYEEKVEITFNYQFKNIKSFIKKRCVPYNSLWDVLFEEPVGIQEDKEYWIRVGQLTPGRYPRADTADGSADTSGPTTVTWLYGGLVRGLLLEKSNK